MKEYYEKPLYIVEEFVANQVIASGCSPKNMETQCLQGTEVGTFSLLSTDLDISGCNISAGYARGAKGAVKSGSSSGTSDTKNGIYGGVNGRYYETPSGADGLLYFCQENTNDSSNPGGRPRSLSVEWPEWNYNTTNNILYHESGHNTYHCEVIAINESDVSSV